MTNEEMLTEYFAALAKLERRHTELLAEIRVYDKRVTLLEEEMDELWEVIAMLRRHEKGVGYGRGEHGVSAGHRRQGIPAVLGM